MINVLIFMLEKLLAEMQHCDSIVTF